MLDRALEIAKFKEVISTASSFLILTHVNPDGDAIGSSLALRESLKVSGKEVSVVVADRAPETFTYLSGFSEIIVFESNRSLLDGIKFDAVIVLDCADRGRLGTSLSSIIPLTTPIPIVNIDHHCSNDNFGSVNIVDIFASSTCELLYEIILTLKLPLDEKVAAGLLTGIITDTGSFRYRSVGSNTLGATKALVECGITLSSLSEALFSEVPLSVLRLQGEAFRRVELTADGRIAHVALDDEIYRAADATFYDSEGLVERLRDIKGVRVAILNRWDGEFWRVSLRGKGERPNLSAIASSFGGGGHVAAAAFRFRPSSEKLPSVSARLIERIESDF
jgi:phosphoesterase RecJ-like protein